MNEKDLKRCFVLFNADLFYFHLSRFLGAAAVDLKKSALFLDSLSGNFQIKCFPKLN